MRVSTVLLVASLALSLPSVAFAQGVPGGGGSGGNFQSQPDVCQYRDGRAYGGPATTGSVGRLGPADVDSAIDDGNEDGDDVEVGARNRGEFSGRTGGTIQRR